MDVGFIGLGTMGSGMAGRLITAGHRVSVWNRTEAKTRPLVEAGAVAVGSPAGMRGADAVFTMLSDDAGEEAVAFGPGGLVDTLAPGAIHVVSSTIGVGTAQRIAAAHRARGRRAVSAPVSGRGDMAGAGKLFVLASGPADARATCQPLFDAIGQRTFGFGDEPGTANAVKLGLNLMLSACIQTMGEAFALTAHHGVPGQDFYELFTATMFSAPVFRIYGDIIVRGAFEPANTAVPIGLKDLRRVTEAAEAAGLELPFAALAQRRLEQAMADGLAHMDWSVIARIAQRNGKGDTG